VVVYDIENEAVAFEPLPEPIEEKDDGNLISVHITESEELIIGGDWDSVFVYDTESQELRTQYAAHAFGASEVRYHESEDMITSTGGGNSVAFYDVESESIVRTYNHDDTIYAADLDAANDIVWFGDGEGEENPGTITGLQLAFEEETVTETETTEEETTEAGMTEEETTAGEPADDADDGSDETTGGSTPGFGIPAALSGLGGLACPIRRRFADGSSGGG